MEHRSFTRLCALLFLTNVHCMPRPICGLQRKLMEKAHGLLEHMDGPFPVECLRGNVGLTIQYPVHSFQNPGAEKMVYRTIQYIDTLFMNDTAPVRWDRQSVDDFQNLVFRQIEEGKCILNAPGATADVLEAELKSYFNQLKTIVGYDTAGFCAWEEVRKELIYIFRHIAMNSGGFIE